MFATTDETKITAGSFDYSGTMTAAENSILSELPGAAFAFLTLAYVIGSFLSLLS